MLKFNTIRTARYLRSRFVEGKFLLASEGTDIQLEIIDLLRRTIKSDLGNIFVGDAFKLERISATQVLVRKGDAWYEGLPFSMRSSKDELVSGSVLTNGVLPPGVTITDYSTGEGKLLTFNTGTTPANTYKIIITASEEAVTDVQDPFLKNATITESTGQKIRLNYKINVVLNSIQTETPIPYTGETGAYNAANLVNQVMVTPTASGNGELLATNLIAGSSIDGRDLELVFRNDPAIGGGNPMPVTTTHQEAFFNGKLIDSRGTEYHINAIFLDADTTKTVIRVDKEFGQPDPQIINTVPFYIKKKDVYVADDSSGAPNGFLFLPLGTVEWTSSGITHNSKIIDSRSRIVLEKDFQNISNQKFDIKVVLGSGTVRFNQSGSPLALNWTGPFQLINPHSSLIQTIASNNAPMVDLGSLAYEMNFSGGAIERGNLAVTVSSAGASTVLSGSPDLSTVRLGNVIQDSGGNVAVITAINDITDTLTVSPALVSTGAAVIYKDSFGPGYVPSTENTFILATRKGNFVYGSFPVATTDFSSDIRGIEAEPLHDRVGTLTDAIGDEQEDRSLYMRSANTVSWTGGNSFVWTADILIQIINTKSGTVTEHSIPAGSFTLIDGESIWVSIDRTAASEVLTYNKSSITPIPAQSQANKDVLVLFRRVGSDLQIPILKQMVVSPNTAFYLGAVAGTSFDLTQILTSSEQTMVINGVVSNVKTGSVLISNDGNILLA